jgi:ACS family glucarate transporter-like MFS transporter
LIERDRPASTYSGVGRAKAIPLVAIVRSFSLWCMSLVMFCTNVGWAFLITWMPTYFTQVHQDLPDAEAANYKLVALLGGPIGLVLGGLVTDLATKRWGLRWGRSGPLFLSRMVGAAAYLSCLRFDSPRAVTVAFFLVGFFTDIGIGGTWAYAQDVGGRHVGSILGWSNMWGNLGAALVAIVLPRVVDIEHATDWDEAFLLCAAAFVIAGIASLGIDATLPIERRTVREDGDESTEIRSAES